MADNYVKPVIHKLNIGDYLGQQFGSSTGAYHYTPSNFDTAAVESIMPKQEDHPGIVSRIIDVLSRPMYAVDNVLKDTIGTNPDTSHLGESFWRGLSGVDKTTGWDLMDKIDATRVSNTPIPDWVKGLGGFALSAGTDPLSYVPLGWAIKPFQAAKSALTGEKAFNLARQAPLEATMTSAGTKAEAKAFDKEAKALGKEKTLDLINQHLAKGNPTPVTEPTIPPTPATVTQASNDVRRGTIGDSIAQDLETRPTTSVRTPETPVGTNPATYREPEVQVNNVVALTRTYSEEAKAKNLSGASRNSYISTRLIPMLKKIKDQEAAAGRYPVIRTPESIYHMDISDGYEIMGKDFSKVHLGRAEQTIPPSSVQAGLGATLDAIQKGLPEEDTIAYIKDAILKGHHVKDIKQAPTEAGASALAKTFYDYRDELIKRLNENEAQYGLRDAAQGTEIGRNTAREVTARLDNPKVSLGENVQDVANISGRIKTEGDIRGVSSGGKIKAAQEAADNLRGRMPPEDIPSARTTSAVARDLAEGRAMLGDAKLYKRLSKQGRRDAEEELRARGPIISLENQVDASLSGRMKRMSNAIFSRTIFGYRHEQLQRLYRNNINGEAGVLHGVLTRALDEVAKKHTPDAIVDGFNSLKLGRNVDAMATGPAQDAARDLLDKFDTLLSLHTGEGKDVGKTILSESAFFKDGATLDTINSLLKEVGLSHKFDLSKLKNPNDMVELAQQWKTWKIKDPIDFLKKFDEAKTRFVTRKAVAEDFAQRFGSTEFKPGWSRIRESNSKMSHVIPHDVFFPPEAIRMLKSFDDAFMKPTSYFGKKGIVAGFYNNIVDPFLRIWKPSVTIARPGFHVRNAIGDYALNAMAGVYSPTHYINAMRMQKAIGRFDGDIAEARKYFAEHNRINDLDSNSIMRTVKLKNGKEEPLTAAMAGQLAARHGLLTTYKSSGAYDILGQESATGAVARITQKLTEDNPYMRTMGRIAQGEQHHFRLAQFDKLLGDSKFTGKFDTIEDAANAAVTETQKFHPDVYGLNPAEAKTMRRLVPFYTWFRQTTPLILSTMITHPARITGMYKAEYGIQQAFGMNTKSYEDPFLQGEQYPSFVTSNLTGPVTIGDSQQYVYNLGTPLESLGDVFNKDIKQPSDAISAVSGGLVGMLNPVLRATPELIGKTKLQNAQYIPDTGEYIDQMLPFINQLANISGVSPTGSVFNTVTGAGPMIDPQRAVQKGEKDYFYNTTTLNFLSGLGIQNVSRPSYRNIRLKEG